MCGNIPANDKDEKTNKSLTVHILRPNEKQQSCTTLNRQDQRPSVIKMKKNGFKQIVMFLGTK